MDKISNDLSDVETDSSQVSPKSKYRQFSKKNSIKRFVKDLGHHAIKKKKNQDPVSIEPVEDQSTVEVIKSEFEISILKTDDDSFLETLPIKTESIIQPLEPVLDDLVKVEANNAPQISFKEEISTIQPLETVLDPVRAEAENAPQVLIKEEISYPIDETIIMSPTIKYLDVSDVNEEDRGNICCSEMNTSSYSGRRIVDFMFLIEQMKNSQHNDFGCSFLDMELVCETQYGFRSSFHFVCKICDSKLIIHSEKKDPSPFIPINEAIVNGTISAGLGYSQLAELSASADLHCMSSSMYGLVVSKYSNEINNATLEEMINSGKEERKLAIEAGDIDENGIPICFVIADHQWLNCCFKKKDDEFSGIATIIGYKTNKILFIGIRNRYCAICHITYNKYVTAPNHTCFFNWTKVDPSMEVDLIAEGFKWSIEMHNLKYKKLIGDGDSSIIKRLREIMPYGPDIIDKVECRDHLLNTYVTKLDAITKNKNYPKVITCHIKMNLSQFKYAISKVLEYRRKLSNQTMEQKILGLREDIINSYRHILGDHKQLDEHCEHYFCNCSNEHNFVLLAKESGVLQELIQVLNCLANNSENLLMNVNSYDLRKEFNDLINKYLAGKQIKGNKDKV